MMMFYVDLRLVVCVADASVRRGMKVGSIKNRSPCARARFPPSIPSVNGHVAGARISSDANVVPLQKRMHDSIVAGANCDPLPDHPAPSRGSSPSRPRPMPGPRVCTVPGFVHT